MGTHHLPTQRYHRRPSSGTLPQNWGNQQIKLNTRQNQQTPKGFVMRFLGIHWCFNKHNLLTKAHPDRGPRSSKLESQNLTSKLRQNRNNTLWICIRRMYKDKRKWRCDNVVSIDVDVLCSWCWKGFEFESWIDVEIQTLNRRSVFRRWFNFQNRKLFYVIWTRWVNAVSTHVCRAVATHWRPVRHH